MSAVDLHQRVGVMAGASPARPRARLRAPQTAVLRRLAFLLRGLLFVGWRYRCPCCKWRLRSFAAKRGMLRSTDDGYCPRCNGKARHRRDWLYFEDHTDLFTARLRLLEVGPRWTFARRFLNMPNIDYVGVDVVRRGPEVTTVGDVTALPLPNSAFDAVICIHVLEHVEDDRGAIAELHRVLRPGGWAIVTVPIQLDRLTYEDPTITAPEARARAFGERGHVRSYGTDFADRLRAAGFEVELHPASEVAAAVRQRCGLRADENIFHCRKAQPTEAGAA